MKTTRSRTLVVTGTTLGTALGTALGTVLTLSAFAAPAQAVDRAHHFRNCTAMHRVWHHGVARSRAAARRDGHGAAVRPAIHRANKSSDRDGDGVACEA